MITPSLDLVKVILAFGIAPQTLAETNFCPLLVIPQTLRFVLVGNEADT